MSDSFNFMEINTGFMVSVVPECKSGVCEPIRKMKNGMAFVIGTTKSSNRQSFKTYTFEAISHPIPNLKPIANYEPHLMPFNMTPQAESVVYSGRGMPQTLSDTFTPLMTRGLSLSFISFTTRRK